jgi:hypothetical protein
MQLVLRRLGNFKITDRQAGLKYIGATAGSRFGLLGWRIDTYIFHEHLPA